MTEWKRSNEPIAWSLFGAGGMVLAFMAPALIIITGVLLPLAAADQAHTVYLTALTLATHPLGKLLLLVIIALPLFHTGHRMYHGLHDLHIYGPKWLLLGLFYGGATVLSLVAAFLLFSF